jgi:hypothetical protein
MSTVADPLGVLTFAFQTVPVESQSQTCSLLSFTHTIIAAFLASKALTASISLDQTKRPDLA